MLLSQFGMGLLLSMMALALAVLLVTVGRWWAWAAGAAATLLAALLTAASGGYALAMQLTGWLGIGVASVASVASSAVVGSETTAAAGPVMTVAAIGLMALAALLLWYLLRRGRADSGRRQAVERVLVAVAGFGVSLSLGLWQAMAEREQQIAEVLGGCPRTAIVARARLIEPAMCKNEANIDHI